MPLANNVSLLSIFARRKSQSRPLPEQRRIVAKLDSLTGRTARARDEMGRIPKLIQKYREAILSAAFSGELTREWRQTEVPKRVDDDIGPVVRRERDAQRAKAGIRPKGKNRSVQVGQ